MIVDILVFFTPQLSFSVEEKGVKQLYFLFSHETLTLSADAKGYETATKHTHTLTLPDWQRGLEAGPRYICIKRGEAGFADDIFRRWPLSCCEASVSSLWKRQRAAQAQAAPQTRRTLIHPHRPPQSFSTFLQGFLISSHSCSDFLTFLSLHFSPDPSPSIPSFTFSVPSLAVSHPPPFSVLFFAPVHTRARHKAENISNLGWGICLFTTLPRNSRAVGLTKAIINGPAREWAQSHGTETDQQRGAACRSTLCPGSASHDLYETRHSEITWGREGEQRERRSILSRKIIKERDRQRAPNKFQIN